MHADAELTLDFCADWYATLRTALTNLGYAPPTDDHGVEVAYFNVLKRLVPPRRRQVHQASSLVCPAELKPGLDEVVRKVRAGEDLRPHLSRTLLRRDFNDLLLNDWGIHHLHLGIETEQDGFVTRTGPVLFARFLDDDAFFIAVPAHGKWSDLQILQTFADEWPEQMARHELRGIAPSREGENPTMSELAAARAGGVQTLVTINGKVYGPMGGGLSTAKVAVDVVIVADRCVYVVKDFERAVVAEKAQILEAAKAAGILERPLRLRMLVRQSGFADAATPDNEFGFPLGQIT